MFFFTKKMFLFILNLAGYRIQFHSVIIFYIMVFQQIFLKRRQNLFYQLIFDNKVSFLKSN